MLNPSPSSSSSSTFPPGIPGVLSLYQSTPTTLSYHDSDPSLPHTLVFLPGLTDTLCSLPYLSLLYRMLHLHRFSLVQPLLTSNMSGWGTCTLEGDAHELASCISHLRSTSHKRDGKVIIMGHSTGCQDVLTYLLSRERTGGERTKVQAAILQAPVSDREDYEWRYSHMSKEHQAQEDIKMQKARELVRQARGGEVLPRLSTSSANDELVLPPTDPSSSTPTTSQGSGNSQVTLSPAFTAYRYTSLYDVGGDDDFFSSSLSNDDITSTTQHKRSMGKALKNLIHANDTSSMLAIMSAEDEYVHPPVDREAIVKRWNDLLGDVPAQAASDRVFEAVILQGANHKVDSVTAQKRLVEMVERMVKRLL